jgi:exonuclease III
VRLVTWNVAGRVTRQAEQAAAVAAIEPDVVALQEVTARTLPLWQRALAEAGFVSVRTALTEVTRPVGGRRLLGVLTAARLELRVLPAPDVPWPERLLCCALGDGEVVNLHSPISPAPELAKVRTHEAVAEYLLASPAAPRVLCGDLNTPRRELPDGTVLTFAHDSAGRLRPERGERWHRAESALVQGLREHGWVDAFRALHGYGEREASWRFPQDRGGWRLDHVLVDGLRPVASAYAHDWRRSGLSDHSALVVDFESPS